MIAWLKAVHIATIAIWAAGLIVLPGIYAQRRHEGDDDALLRLQRLVRFCYLVLISPAAFIAIASGTALIFLRGTFDPWMSAKLTLVSVMVVMHALTGLVVIRLFAPGQSYPSWRFAAETCVMLMAVAGILYLVLAKPSLQAGERLLPAALTEPGALKPIIQGLNPWSTP